MEVLVDFDPHGKIFCCVDDLITLGFFDENSKSFNYATELIIGTTG